jgi:hypothetical protein
LHASRRRPLGSRCEAEPIGLAVAILAVTLLAYVYWGIFDGFYESMMRRVRMLEESLTVEYAYYVDEEEYIGWIQDLAVDGEANCKVDLGVESIHTLEVDTTARSISGYVRVRIYLYDHSGGGWDLISEFTVGSHPKLYGPFRFYDASRYLSYGSIDIRFEAVNGSIHVDRSIVRSYLRRSNIVRIGLHCSSQSRSATLSRIWLYDPYRVGFVDCRYVLRYGSVTDVYVDAGSPYVYMVKIVTEDGGVYPAYIWGGRR